MRRASTAVAGLLGRRTATATATPSNAGAGGFTPAWFCAERMKTFQDSAALAPNRRLCCAAAMAPARQHQLVTVELISDTM